MADDLNSFFAKKDKKKAGKKTTVALKPGNASPTLSRPARTPTPETAEAAPARAPAPAPATTTIKPSIFKDDDWIVPEEKVTDYTGLRIQDLSIAEPEKEIETVEEETPQATGKKMWGATKKPADDVSTFAFPSLSQTVGDVGAPPPPGMKNFKAVRNGYKGDGLNRQAEKVQLTNRYAAFQNE